MAHVVHKIGSDKKRVQFRAPHRLVDRADALSTADATTVLNAVSDARSWDANSYVQRARSLLERS
ncbi:hypothetical protein [Halorubrum sp. AS12]|uniref:hypothetical protein n=1 Tax=Halorubrum sp. AS12 TaxID=3409687 RepID=UPI003DA72408